MIRCECNKGRYCDMECKQLHWEMHKDNCKVTQDTEDMTFIFSLNVVQDVESYVIASSHPLMLMF